MQPYQLAELNIEDIGFEGEGIAHYEGYTIFVPFAAPGERVRARITTVNARKNIAFARVESVIEQSPDRVKPPCRVNISGSAAVATTCTWIMRRS